MEIKGGKSRKAIKGEVKIVPLQGTALRLTSLLNTHEGKWNLGLPFEWLQNSRHACHYHEGCIKFSPMANMVAGFPPHGLEGGGDGGLLRIEALAIKSRIEVDNKAR